MDNSNIITIAVVGAVGVGAFIYFREKKAMQALKMSVPDLTPNQPTKSSYQPSKSGPAEVVNYTIPLRERTSNIQKKIGAKVTGEWNDETNRLFKEWLAAGAPKISNDATYLAFMAWQHPTKGSGGTSTTTTNQNILKIAEYIYDELSTHQFSYDWAGIYRQVNALNSDQIKQLLAAYKNLSLGVSMLTMLKAIKNTSDPYDNYKRLVERIQRAESLQGFGRRPAFQQRQAAARANTSSLVSSSTTEESQPNNAPQGGGGAGYGGSELPKPVRDAWISFRNAQEILDYLDRTGAESDRTTILSTLQTAGTELERYNVDISESLRNGYVVYKY